MRHGDADDRALVGSVWVHKRTKPKGKEAEAGQMGLIANCLPGDLVACESLDGKRVIWLAIAWLWPDGKAVQARLWDFRQRCIGQESRHLRTIQSRQRCRWLGVRPK